MIPTKKGREKREAMAAGCLALAGFIMCIMAILSLIKNSQ